MPKPPKISVIIPAYNIAPYILETLESVFAQTFTDFEVIVVNDGSPDTPELERVINPFRSKIVYLTQENGGAAAARNTAIRHAKGELLAFLDGDDVWLPEYLARQIEFLTRHNLDMVYSNALFFGDTEHDNRPYMDIAESVGEVTTTSLFTGKCSVIISGTVVSKQKVVDAGMFDTARTWWRTADFELWFRLAKAGAKINYHREILLKYRVRGEGLFGDRKTQAEGFITTLNGIRGKYELTAAENQIWNEQMIFSQANLQAELGKEALQNGDFTAARKHFAETEPFYNARKRTLLKLALHLAPHLTRKIVIDKAS